MKSLLSNLRLQGFKWEFGGQQKTNKHKQFRRIVLDMGGGQVVYLFPFFLGKNCRETHKQHSQEISGKGRDSPGIIPGQSREHFVYTFSCLLVFPGPKNEHLKWATQQGSFLRGTPKVEIGAFKREWSVQARMKFSCEKHEFAGPTPY